MRYKLLIIALLFTICGCAHPLIGKSVTGYNSLWCQFYAFPAKCVIQTQHLRFVYEVDFNSATGEYSVKGHAEPISIGSFSRFQTEKSDFYFILANDRVVTDVISFYLSSGMVQDKIPISFKFKSKPFNAMGIKYNFVVIG